jgi:hypothetical protein
VLYAVQMALVVRRMPKLKDAAPTGRQAGEHG